MLKDCCWDGSSRVPGFIRTFAPASALRLIEEAWNAYPYCKTSRTISTLSRKFFTIHTIHCLTEMIGHEFVSLYLSSLCPLVLTVGLDSTSSDENGVDEEKTDRKKRSEKTREIDSMIVFLLLLE